MQTATAPYSGPERRANGGAVVIDESWVKVFTKFGLGGGLAAFLVWQLAGDIKTNTTQTNATIQRHVDETKAQNSDRDRILQIMANVLVQQCVNAATNKEKRDACFDAINRGVWVREPREPQ
jgi:hypothetical protein